MSSLYQNKIIKQPSQQKSLSGHKASVSFSSKNQRFQQTIQKSPGPGSYQYKTTNYKLPQYYAKRDRNNQSHIKMQHQWIWGSDRNSYMGIKNMSNYVGPGSYNVEMHEAVIGRTNWNKSERFYSTKINKIGNVPGPGSYQNKTQHPKNTMASVFKSKSPRTLMQKLTSETQEVDYKKSQVKQFIQNPQVSPSNNLSNSNAKSDYEAKKKKLKSSVFCSKIPRFPSENQNSLTNLGPGSYNIDNIQRQRSHDKLPRIITVKDEEKLKKIVKPQPLQVPGPGAYQTDLKTIERSLETQGHVLIGSEPRFTYKHEKNPGPGHYLREKKTYAGEMEKMHKLRFSPQKPSFNSSAERSSLELSSKQNPLCNYNLDYYDMQHKMKKNQQHIQKLRIMQVTLPAFNTKSRK